MAITIGKEYHKQHITVEFLYESTKNKVKLDVVSNVGIENKIKDKNLHRPGLAIAGYVDLFTYNRVQVYAKTEYRYLKRHPSNNLVYT